MTSLERRRNIVVAILSTSLVVPVVWMLMDRDPPYSRVGEIVAADPRHCELPEDTPTDDVIRAGGCIEVKWKLTIARTCPAVDKDNVVRHLRDSTGVLKTLGSFRSVVGDDRKESPEGVHNYLVLPAPMPTGPASYSSSACYACNPLQHIFWPVCVDTPDIHFEVMK